MTREEAINELKIMRNLYSHIRRHDREWEATELAISALSQPERPKGRWIWKRNKVGNGCHCVCSVCGRAENKQEPFCNCGADMRGGEEHDSNI